MTREPKWADFNGYATQIAAFDAVVAISNTTINVAGMTEVPPCMSATTICLTGSGRDRASRPVSRYDLSLPGAPSLVRGVCRG